MSLREKIGQTVVQHVEHAFGVGLANKITSEMIGNYLADQPVGGLFIGGEVIRHAYGAYEMYSELINNFQEKSPIPLLISGDMESGAGGAVASLTRFPSMLALGAADNKEHAYNIGKHTALEGRMAGFNWNFAPVVDLALNWLNPIVGVRALGDNPFKVAELAALIIKGMQEHGMAACAKHFPGDGVDLLDQHICTSVNSLNEEEWREQFGAVYKTVIEAGVYSIMNGHIALPWIEPYDKSKNRHRPATVSKKILLDLLRNELNFKGLIVSDALNMGGSMKKPEIPHQDDAQIKENFNVAKQISAEIAGNSITVARNRKGILPLDPHSTNKMLVAKIGAKAASINADMDGVIGLLKKRGIEVTVMENFESWDCLTTIRNMELEGNRCNDCGFLYPFGNRYWVFK